ncbi:hypothetical protein LXT21_41860 [Myxococcus sp. K38C18041901]|uniref:hypothetical protein n=1 Tax=Myxococcus guangdongensis TaxID=2906760 RepID=UPI0020A7D265|nr:hypothetical protein [Myxococcus guangdongensis]MCP3065337.1 hypothetical protein [Myxococcus guangdongensis]
MKLLLVTLGVWLFAGCATLPASPVDAGGGGNVSADPHPDMAPVRLQTRAGTFLVHPNKAEDFARALAGEPTRQHYTTGVLMAGE